MARVRCVVCLRLTHCADSQIETKANGDLYSRTGRPNECGQLGAVDPDGRAIVVHLYEGLASVIPVDSATGELGAAFSVRLDELGVVDLTLVHGARMPQLVLLYEDALGVRHVSSYYVQLEERTLVRAELKQADVPAGARCVVALPAPLGGVLVAGEQALVHIDRNSRRVVRAVSSALAAIALCVV